MSSEVWLSILIPVYNVEAYLRDCLESVVTQDCKGIEIVVLDDCSTDTSKKVLDEFVAQASVNIIPMQHQHNQGLSAARNSMLDIAQGKYIWFLDSDDLMEPNAIRQLKSIVDAHTPDLVLCDFRVLREKQSAKNILRGENHCTAFVGTTNQLLNTSEDLFYGLYKKGELHVWSKIAKRNLWGDDLRFPVGRNMEDMVITPRLALRTKTYYYQPSVWIAYRRREGSILATLNENKITDAALGCEGVLQLWLKKYPQLSTKAHLTFSHYCARTHYVVMRDLNRLKPAEFKQKKEQFRQQFFYNIHWQKWQLCWQYGKNGKISRLLRFLINH